MGGLATIERFAPPRVELDEQSDRIVGALLGCVGRWGIGKTTADDVAREAGVSRATLYRTFPGGMEVVLDTAVRREAARFFELVTSRLEAAPDLTEMLVVGITEAARFLAGHAALRHLLEHEPERLLPAFTFDRLARTLEVATSFAQPHLQRFVPDAAAAADGAEWVVRILLSYATNRSGALSLTDETDVRRFVTTYLTPALDPSAP